MLNMYAGSFFADRQRPPSARPVPRTFVQKPDVLWERFGAVESLPARVSQTALNPYAAEFVPGKRLHYLACQIQSVRAPSAKPPRLTKPAAMKLVIVTPPMERAAVLEEKRSQGELPAVDTRLPVQEGRRTPTPALCFFTPNPRLEAQKEVQRKEIAATRPVDQILAAEEKEAEMPSKAAGERQNSLASFGPGEDNKPLDLAAEPSTGCETKGPAEGEAATEAASKQRRRRRRGCRGGQNRRQLAKHGEAPAPREEAQAADSKGAVKEKPNCQPPAVEESAPGQLEHATCEGALSGSTRNDVEVQGLEAGWGPGATSEARAAWDSASEVYAAEEVNDSGKAACDGATKQRRRRRRGCRGGQNRRGLGKLGGDAANS